MAFKVKIAKAIEPKEIQITLTPEEAVVIMSFLGQSFSTDATYKKFATWFGDNAEEISEQFGEKYQIHGFKKPADAEITKFLLENL